MVPEETDQNTRTANPDTRDLLRTYGLGCPRLDTEEAFRNWLVLVGRRFACHLGMKTRSTVLCHGWGRLWRRGQWFHPLVFTVGDRRLVFDVSLREMHFLGEAHLEQQLLASEQLYRSLENALRSSNPPRRPLYEGERADCSGETEAFEEPRASMK